MTKVEHTKTHIVDRPNETASGKHTLHESILVTDAELVLVECEEVKHAILHNIINKNSKFYKPILISEIEKIEVGDWIYCVLSKEILKYDGKPNMHYIKILALPKHFSPQQLQDIADGKLKGKLLVECEQEEPIPMIYKGVDSRGDYLYYCPKCKHGGSYMGTGQAHCYKDECRPITIKLNPHITIYPVEEKMYTREEMIKNAFNFYYDMSNRMKVPFNLISENITNAEEWFEQNVK